MSLIVYGANCIWWDSIDKAAIVSPMGLPVCPHCGSPLFQMGEEQWFDSVKKYNDEVEDGYSELIEWQRGKCFKTTDDARKAYEKEKNYACKRL